MGRSFLSIKLAALFGLLVGAGMFAQGAVAVERPAERPAHSEEAQAVAAYASVHGGADAAGGSSARACVSVVEASRTGGSPTGPIVSTWKRI